MKYIVQCIVICMQQTAQNALRCLVACMTEARADLLTYGMPISTSRCNSISGGGLPRCNSHKALAQTRQCIFNSLTVSTAVISKQAPF